VEIRARVQGYIVEMPVDEGDIVEEGQVLFRLNGEQYGQEVRSAEADVEAAKAAVETARDEVPMGNPFGRKLIGRMATTLISTGRSVILPGGLISESNSILKLIMYEFQ
jgi:pyruvate/2-oxoglutarate dehydrogenase complex dihydrolipoamide acyltransferase (E2) component